LPINIGIANGGPKNDNPGLDITDLPVFNLSCVSGPNVGNTYTVTDPGRALISGLCADIGKVKGPILRGLAGRAPYFHNGSAATLLDVVNFYVQRFDITFTDAEKAVRDRRHAILWPGPRAQDAGLGGSNVVIDASPAAPVLRREDRDMGDGRAAIGVTIE
jgi:hypothetical protein